MKRVAIVGGGISGLATAYYLRRSRPDLAVTVLEARPRLGGVIATERRDGFVVEGGPDSFVTFKPWARQLCRELGMESRLIPTNPANRKVYIVSRGRLEVLPPGLMMTAPTRVLPFLKTGLISWPGKFRMALDLLLPRGPEQEDESLGAFIERRLGREAVAKIADPILGGIFLSETRRLSLRCTFPRFREMERKHRSLILGMRRESAGTGSGGGENGLFRAFDAGMIDLVDGLRRALPEVEFRTGCRVLRVGRNRVVLTEAGELEAAAVVVAVPPPDAAALLEESFPDLAARIGAIPSVSTATVSLGYRHPRPTVALDASGFVIATGENRRILACTWSSRKFTGRAPEGHLLVRCFFGGGKNEAILNASDDDLVRFAREELSDLMGLHDEPVLRAVFRWPGANPIYEVGHEGRVEQIDRMVEPALNLHLTGSGFRGVGIPDCVKDAQRVAGAIARST